MGLAAVVAPLPRLRPRRTAPIRSRSRPPLSIDTRITPHLPPSTAVLSAILTHVTAAGARLRAFMLKFPDCQLSLGPGAPLVAQLLAAHARSLTVLAFLDCTLGTTDVLREIISTRALAHSKTLCTLIDVPPHAPPVKLKRARGPEARPRALAFVWGGCSSSGETLPPNSVPCRTNVTHYGSTSEESTDALPAYVKHDVGYGAVTVHASNTELQQHGGRPGAVTSGHGGGKLARI
ncbi:hypothetical protein B0H15DRAFT_1003509 [Mycena belliarum]|uniref:Uncharacterized protein n=1 Tax=Mycena belliarum TaxID=1033014 RepID=A0AAD6TTX7_9AGAR|nr:hypothetical protein B0H15DRAFT_1003509 [Mycena belliae]